MENNIEAVLSSAGLRLTKQRKIILDLLIDEGVPLAHGEIISKLDEHIDRVTLYRTLETLRKAGIVHQVQGIDGVWRFCAHENGPEGCPGDHPHFLCTTCGKMICMTDQKMPRVTVREGMEVQGKQFVIYGTCLDCVSNKDKKQ